MAINLTNKVKDIVKSVILAGIVQLLLTGALVAVFNFSTEMATLIALIPTLVVFGVLLRALDVL